ncbi:MAG TPA: hypothetical protein VFG22_05305 [Polyangiales bacterium]|jgi:uncharacterized low-complexity protein|nr:hypothetical protein [Polyangiales bacterium]
MNSALKHTIIAMATAALSVTAACKSDDGPEAAESTTGAETAAAAEAGAAEASCGEGSCSGAMKEGQAAEASCGEGSCGSEN